MESVPHCGVFIREELAKHNWQQVDLAAILGVSVAHVSDLCRGKRRVSATMAHMLAAAFMGTTAELWMARETAYRLSQVKDRPRDTKIGKRLSAMQSLTDEVSRLRDALGYVRGVVAEAVDLLEPTAVNNYIKGSLQSAQAHADAALEAGSSEGIGAAADQKQTEVIL